ncbi:MAG TPA: AbrB/MazE/SpoVT family DNA-binding domain-containing protein [Candidatus Deferrimicrobium sp.]|nr:AbrB/MazE/SpoVT family DNA-binding domain-containing protein [Candidatus Deferrimicrobium sp.]
MVIVKIDKKGRLVIPKDFREKLKIDKSTPLIFEIEDQNAIKIRVIQSEDFDFTSDPVWIAIHNPVLLPKQISNKDLEELEDEQWSS